MNDYHKSDANLPPPPPAVTRKTTAPIAAGLGTPLDFRGNPMRGNQGNASQTPVDTQQIPAEISEPQSPRKQATEVLAARAGALSDEIDFVDFVAGLVHGTFDAIVDASIRQMESYADLVSAVAKTVDQFTEDNVTLNQARDWLVQQYPQDLVLDLNGAPQVRARPLQGDDEGIPSSPIWLRDYDLEGQDLTDELIEESILPRARLKVGHSRQQTLATIVLLGLNRVVVKDGTVSARLRFRAAASDKAKVDYAVSNDPGGGSSWGNRGASSYHTPSTKVSTVGVNVQSDAELKAELFGEVKINFASETLPLEKFADEARRTILERRARPSQATAPRSPEVVATPAPPATTPVIAQPIANLPAAIPTSPPVSAVQPAPPSTPPVNP